MIIGLSLLIDWFLGEPPSRLHPVVWFGQLLTAVERFRGKGSDFLLGTFVILCGAVVVFFLMLLLVDFLESLHIGWYILLTLSLIHI